MASRKTRKTRSRRGTRKSVGGKSNRYIEPQMYPKNLPDGYVAKGKDKKFWQIKNGLWTKPAGVKQETLKKVYFNQLLAKKKEAAKKENRSRSKKSREALD